MSSSRFRQAWWRCSHRQLVFALAVVMGCRFPALAESGTNAPKADPNPPSPRKPGIILIVADDLGYGDLGCYGQAKIKTPNLDRLAAEGMRFTSFYAGSSLSTPSRTALLTGRHTGHTSNRGVAVFPLPPGELLLPEILSRSGYATAAAGKWGLSNATPPGRRGFDDWIGYLSDSDTADYYPPILGVTRRNPKSNLPEDYPSPGLAVPANEDGKQGEYADDRFMDSILRFLTYSKPQSYTSYRGFFAYLAPAIPYAGPETGPQTSAGAKVPSDAPYSDKTAWLPAERTRAAMITRLDSYVGQLLDKLKELKNDKNTMVIFTSATGPQHDAEIDPAFFRSTGGLRGFKHDLYEGAIRVPLIVRWPIQIKPGTTSDRSCAAWDLLPTLAEAAQTSAPAGIDGISLLPTLTGHAQTNRHEYLYWELHDHGFKQAIRAGDWKAVRMSADGPFELYNLQDDPGEKNNVAARNPEIIARFGAFLQTARTDDPHWPVKRPDPAEEKTGP